MARKFLFFTLFLFLSACAPLATGTPPPAPQVIRVAYPPALSNWGNMLQTCALQTPDIALTLVETSPSAPEFVEADVSLNFGEPPGGINGYAAALGTDEIVIIAGAQVNLTTISAAELHAIYTQAESSYQPWTYGAGDELRLIFEAEILAGAAPSAEVWLAPHPRAMLEAITENPRAIGYLPRSWLNARVKTLALTELIEIPILGITETEPAGALRAYLACLQQNSQ